MISAPRMLAYTVTTTILLSAAACGGTAEDWNQELGVQEQSLIAMDQPAPLPIYTTQPPAVDISSYDAVKLSYVGITDTETRRVYEQMYSSDWKPSALTDGGTKAIYQGRDPLVYYDVAFAGDRARWPEHVDVEIYLDGVLVHTDERRPFGAYFNAEVLLAVSIVPGTHQVLIKVDPLNKAGELGIRANNFFHYTLTVEHDYSFSVKSFEILNPESLECVPVVAQTPSSWSYSVVHPVYGASVCGKPLQYRITLDNEGKYVSDLLWALNGIAGNDASPWIGTDSRYSGNVAIAGGAEKVIEGQWWASSKGWYTVFAMADVFNDMGEPLSDRADNTKKKVVCVPNYNVCAFNPCSGKTNPCHS